MGWQVWEIKSGTVRPKDLFSKLFFGGALVQRVLLPGQGVFSTAVSSSSVLSCFYFRKQLLVRSPALLSTARGPLRNRSFVMDAFAVIVCWHSFGLV